MTHIAKSDYQLLIMQDTIEEKRQDYDEKTKNTTEDLTSMITSMVDQIKISKSSPEKRDSSKYQDTTTMLLDNNRAPPLEGVHLQKMVACGLSNMKSAHQNSMKSSSR